MHVFYVKFDPLLFKNWEQSTKDTLFNFDGKVHTCTCNPITYNTEGWFACFFIFACFVFCLINLRTCALH